MQRKEELLGLLKVFTGRMTFQSVNYQRVEALR